jgi:hypothetical protein
MNTNHEAAGRVAQGWLLLFLVMLGIFLSEMAVSVIVDAPGGSREEALQGVQVMVALIGLHAAMPVLIWTIEARWFRWVTVLLTAGLTLFMVGHQIEHLLAQDRPLALLNVLDFAHDAIGAWVTWLAWRWVAATGTATRPAQCDAAQQGA